jgi:hypothetical protein
MIFRRVSVRGSEELTTDQVALQVLRMLDGQHDLATLARFSRLDTTNAIKVITRLCKASMQCSEPGFTNQQLTCNVDTTI